MFKEKRSTNFAGTPSCYIIYSWISGEQRRRPTHDVPGDDCQVNDDANHQPGVPVEPQKYQGRRGAVQGQPAPEDGQNGHAQQSQPGQHEADQLHDPQPPADADSPLRFHMQAHDGPQRVNGVTPPGGEKGCAGFARRREGDVS
jgi:hypothetical protein